MQTSNISAKEDNHPTAVTVLGAGSWGTAIAVLLARKGITTRLWGRDSSKMQIMAEQGCNPYFLPEIIFPDTLLPTADLQSAINQSDLILIAVPSHAFRASIQSIKQYPKSFYRIAWLTKGLENGTQKLLHQVVLEEFNQPLNYAVISGPTFALEVARGLPTAVTIAANNPEFSRELAELFHTATFRPYISEDIIGLEIGGAVKNVLAIAAGIADGLGYGANTRSALITRGIAEMMRLALKAGADKETVMGLSGIGDLMLTCTDNLSRNRRMGLALGQGKTLQQAKTDIAQVVEGIQTAKEIYNLAEQLDVHMPISEQVYRILYQGLSPEQAVKNLLQRDFTYERI